MENKSALKGAKDAVNQQIKFLKDLKKHLNGDLPRLRDLAIWTVGMLDTYIEKKLMDDVAESINRYNETKT
jgi:hypothetical protein